MARSSRRLARKTGTATEAETIAIVCEGQKTEDIYFSGIRREFRLATARIRVVGLGADPLRVVQEAESLRPQYDHTWAVFDIEAPGAHAIPHPRLSQAIERAGRAGIRCAISNPCFELWLLLHFHPQTAYLNNEAVRARIRQCGCGYDAKGFEFAKVWPHHQNAILNATKLDARQRSHGTDLIARNPWTNVHELVRTEALVGLGGDQARAPVRGLIGPSRSGRRPWVTCLVGTRGGLAFPGQGRVGSGSRR